MEAERHRVLQFWGKAQPGANATVSAHPLAYHSLDVAAVAQMLLLRRGEPTSRMAASCELPLSDFVQLCTFLVSLHDLGKFSKSFQALAEPHWPAILGPLEKRDAAAHWQLSLDLLGSRKILRYLDAHWPGGRCILDRLMLLNAVAGHHGRPATPPAGAALDSGNFSESCQAAVLTFIDAVLTLLQPPPTPELSERAAKRFSFWLAGLTVTADWLGSNQEFFPYRPPEWTLADYWQQIALPNAEKAVRAAGLLPSPADPAASLVSLFAIADPRPMQLAMGDLEIPEGPTLVIIEDATGSGKTEAAALLAQRMMLQGKAGGLYFALPTMATANGMFGRMVRCYRGLFTADTQPSLALAHGRASEHPGFRAVTLPQATTPSAQRGEDRDTAAACADWIADDRRKVFLAEIGVGTIDQSLLCILPSKFQSLRLWGLSDRILIVDEAHAYDAYMAKELETLLEFHAALGGSAIILSATLPAKKRAALVAAFRNGAGAENVAAPPPNAAYPLITIATRGGVEERADIAAAAHTCRRVAAQRLPDREAALAEIAGAAAKGAAVAYVCNAVDDAIEAAAELRRHGITVDLFHARYMMGERQEIEQRAIERFGPKDVRPQDRRRVLVATQVIEQSLDLDFDLMVSDLAPIDLLIQRAGRLWRHMQKRPDAQRPVTGSRLLVVSPDPDPAQITDDQWLHLLGHKGAFVYRNHALLWRTAWHLFGNGGFAAPGDLRRLIEAVYDLLDDPTPEALRDFDLAADGDQWGDRTLADFNVLKLDDGYSRAGSWLEETVMPTRLGEETRIIRLASIEGDALAPKYRAPDPVRAWSLSEVSVNARWLKGAVTAAAWRSAADATRANWPKFQLDMLIAPVAADGHLLLDNLPSPLFYTQNGLERQNDKHYGRYSSPTRE